MNEQHWQDWLVVVVGFWLVASNWVLSYVLPETAPAGLDATIFWNALLTGAAANRLVLHSQRRLRPLLQVRCDHTKQLDETLDWIGQTAAPGGHYRR